MSLLRRWIDQKELKDLEQEIKQIFDDFSLSLEQVLPFQEKQARIRSLKERAENWIKKLKKIISRNGELNLLIPPADLVELDAQYKIFIDLPGINKNSLQVLIKDRELYIQGEKPPIKSKERYISLESGRGEYYRKISLPQEVDEDKIQARLQNGVLEIILPKKSSQQVRTVEIHPA